MPPTRPCGSFIGACVRALLGFPLPLMLALVLGGAPLARAQEDPGGEGKKPAEPATPAKGEGTDASGKGKDEQPAEVEDAPGEPVKTSPGVRVVPTQSEEDFRKNFRPDTSAADRPYSAEAQIDIYGKKHGVKTQRPILELGRELYTPGELPASSFALGRTNPVLQHFWIYGDYRLIGAYNDFGGTAGKDHQALLATKLTLDFDYQFTSTERLHAQFTPLDFNGKFTRYDIEGDNDDQVIAVLDPNPDTVFFEGDLGAILGGIRGHPSTFDMPVTFGRIPLLFHNGIWLNDAFDGLAFTPIVAQNSAGLDISNMDVTLFMGVNDVNTAAVQQKDDALIGGLNAFVEFHGSYFEVGYAYVDDRSESDLSYHSLAFSWTRRHSNIISNSVRIMGSVGQDPARGFRAANGDDKTADGVAVLLETSFQTGEAQQALVPYLNLFAGFGRPQPLARTAGGLLTNTGITFESDGITGFPTLDDTANNTYGGAVGVEYLFDLNRQLVLEFGSVQVMDDDDHRNLKDPEYAVGLRFQEPINNAMILRLDGIYGWRDNDDDIAGVRLEFRFKF